MNTSSQTNKLQSKVELKLNNRYECFEYLLGKCALTLAIAAIHLMISTAIANAADITVDSLADTMVASDGDCTLREAVNNVNTGTETTGGDCVAADGVNDTINLPTGTITLLGAADDDNNLSGDLDITENVTINGSPDGTTISGGSDGTIVTDRVIHINAVIPSGSDINPGGTKPLAVVLDSLTIKDGNIDGNMVDNGGGILNDKATVSINSSTVANNVTSSSGGGIYNNNGDLTVRNSTVSGNSSGVTGGGILTTANSNVDIIYSTITNNYANGNGSAGGGGLHSTLGAINLIGSIVAGNSAGSGEHEIDESISLFGSGITSNGLNLFGHDSVTFLNAIANSVALNATDLDATSDGTDTPLNQILDASLRDNGGATFTHALVLGSPAIDAGGSSGLTTDQRGVTRGLGTADDIGVYEGTTSRLRDSMSEALGSFSYDNTNTANGATLGTLLINFELTYNSGNPLEHIFFDVTSATNAFLQNAGGGPNGLGANLAMDNSALPGGNNFFDPGETLSAPFEIGVINAPWGINFEMYAFDPTTVAAASRVPIASFTVDSTMFDLGNQPLIEPHIFLPFAVR